MPSPRSLLIVVMLASASFPAPAAENDPEDRAYETLTQISRIAHRSVGAQDCTVRTIVNFEGYADKLDVFREAWLNRDNSLDFYRMRRKQIFVGIILKRHAELITEGLYQDRTPDACRFSTAITFDDKFGQTQTLPALSWTFDRKLADRINWQKFDPKEFAEVTPGYTIADGVLDWMADEPGAPKGRRGGSASDATADACNPFLFQANAVFIRATTFCPTNHMDSEAGYRALAGAKRCTGLANLDARIKSAMQEFDRRVRQEGRTRACTWVASVARRVLGGEE